MTNTQIKAFVALVFVVTGIALAAQGKTPSWESLRQVFSSVDTGVAFVMLLWDRYLWSWPILRRLAKRPDIRGTWKGSIDSGWEDPENGKPPKPNEGDEL